MVQQTLILAASAGAVDALGARGDPAQRWWTPIHAAWPAAAMPPAVRSLALEDVFRQLAAPDAAKRLRHSAPLLLILGPDDRGSTLYQLVDRLQQHALPAVLLFPAVEPALRELQSGGIIIEGWDADPAFLAAVLFALAERETAVRALTRDLAILSRYQGGVRGEIDRIHDELNLAAAVQQEMLPRRLPEVPGVQFGVLFRPAGYVSGDIYDIVQLDDRHIGFFIADAVGHGVPAALMTVVLTRGLRMQRPVGKAGAAAAGGEREIVWPAEAMTRLNDELCRGRRESPRFSTAVYGILDIATRQVTLTGAGHPPPLRLRGRCMTRVETDGPLLGVFPGEQYTEITFTLAEDETLLLYSDGFETAFSETQDEEEGMQDEASRTEASRHRHISRRASERYLSELAALPWPAGAPATERPAADAIIELARRLDEQAGSLHQIDDVTAVAICLARAAAQAPAPPLSADTADHRRAA